MRSDPVGPASLALMIALALLLLSVYDRMRDSKASSLILKQKRAS
jgi:hypothetical protein